MMKNQCCSLHQGSGVIMVGLNAVYCLVASCSIFGAPLQRRLPSVECDGTKWHFYRIALSTKQKLWMTQQKPDRSESLACLLNKIQKHCYERSVQELFSTCRLHPPPESSMQLANITAELRGVPLMSTSCHTVTSMSLLSWVNGALFPHIQFLCETTHNKAVGDFYFIYLCIWVTMSPSLERDADAELKTHLPAQNGPWRVTAHKQHYWSTCSCDKECITNIYSQWAFC